MFQWVAASLPLLSLKKKGERRIGAVRWFDEYSDLGDNPHETHDEMAREHERLRKSYVWRSPFRDQVFGEILKHRRAFEQVSGRNRMNRISTAGRIHLPVRELALRKYKHSTLAIQAWRSCTD